MPGAQRIPVAPPIENPAGVRLGPTLEALGRVPGVASVAAATAMPFRRSGVGGTSRVAADAAGANAVVAERAQITPAFFATLGVAMREGRAFTASDTPAARVVILNAEPTEMDNLADAVLRGSISELLPRLV